LHRESKNRSPIYDRLKVDCGNCSLSSLCIPRGLKKEDIVKLSDVVSAQKTLGRRDYLYHEGDPFRGLLSLKSGTCKIVSTDSEGKEHILGMLLPGELFGFDALSTDIHTCSAIALETISYCELPANQLEDLCLKVPGLLRELFRHTGERITDDTNMIVLNRSPADQRLATFLVSLSDRYSRRGFSAVDFNLSMTRQEIGNHLGLALETVSRLLKQFEQKHLIDVQNKNIHIRDITALKSLSACDPM